MSLPVLLLAGILAQQSGAGTPPKLKRPGQPAAAPQEENPPEEDADLKPTEYSFNPIQATKELQTGDYYMKRGKYNAAAARYREATRWNDQLAEAYRKLGEAEEKQEDPKLARDAYEHFLTMDPDSKQAAEVKKRLKKLPPA